MNTKREKWIWLPHASYPDAQVTVNDNMTPGDRHFTVAEFTRTYGTRGGQPIRSVTLFVSADTAFLLECNAKTLFRGPVSAGGDFYMDGFPRPDHYATAYTLTAGDDPVIDECLAAGVLPLRALVRLSPVRGFEFSRGRGGFCLWGEIRFADGTETMITTGKDWQVRRLGAYAASCVFDGTVAPDAPMPAEEVENIWFVETAPIPPCTEEVLLPGDGGADGKITVPAHGKVDLRLPVDKVYAAYLRVRSEMRATGVVRADVYCFETDDEGDLERLTFAGDQVYEGMYLHSAGGVRAVAENDSDADAALFIELVTTCFPVETEAVTTTSDEDLDLVLRTCAHSLKYCRQTLHLDSPRHCEPLACTGDYYIETLMTVMTFGDMRLSALDVRRTAQLIRYHDGRMFHTSYSLIWVQMLRDVYYLTGDYSLLTDCRDALDMLLDRFNGYVGETGLIETPPDFMFVDWLNPDGINLHHPPKNLGQGTLCMFYFGALETAAHLYDLLGLPGMADRARARVKSLRTAIYAHLWDPVRGLFFEGLNTPVPESMLCQKLPQTTEKRYYMKHSNILAAYFGLPEPGTTKALLRRILDDGDLGLDCDLVQPYFQHFLLEAVYRNGLRDEYTLRLLEQWKKPVRDCPGGLPEGFYPPTPEYHFDHSHAWAGTPAWALPRALSGLEILEPGWRKISLSPSLLGLESADVRIPTPHGMIEIDLRAGKAPVIRLPNGIESV